VVRSSPRERLARSGGVGASVLLRQPGGFEGLVPLPVHNKALDCSVADRPYLLATNRCLYPITTPKIDGAEKDHVLTGIDELVGFNPNGLEDRAEVLTKRRA
jgi:hypothetical protein